MKKRSLILSITAIGLAFCVGSTQKATAKKRDGTLAIKICTVTSEDGKILSLGNTCVEGTSACIANACSSISND
jgi:hypothetical protein